jgi:hypothetical protein
MSFHQIGHRLVQTIFNFYMNVNPVMTTKKILVSHNYGVSVHHPAFQKYYHQQKQYYLNLFGGNLPKPLSDYYELHHI